MVTNGRQPSKRLRFDAETVTAFLRREADDLGGNRLSKRAHATWARAHPPAPTPATVAARFDSWNDAVATMGLSPLPVGWRTRFPDEVGARQQAAAAAIARAAHDLGTECLSRRRARRLTPRAGFRQF